MLNQVDLVIDKVGNILPKTFPESIASSLFEAMRFSRNRLAKS